MKRLVVFISAVLVGFSPGIAHGATALLMGGVGPFSQLDETQMVTALGGHFAEYDQRISVPFRGWATLPVAIEAGADSMVSAIVATPGPKTIGGVSKSAPVIDEVLRRLMEDPNRPPREELDAVIYGYPNPTELARSGVQYRPLPETPYDILLVKAQYDGVADWPDNPLNFLAVLNALMGMGQLHVEAAFFDIDDVPRIAPYYTQTTNSLGGTTTSILIPTPILPLLRPLAPNGVETDFVRFLDSVLRPVIDRAYNRPAVPPSASQRSAVGPDLAAQDASGQSVTTTVSSTSEDGSISAAREVAVPRVKRRELRDTAPLESRVATRSADEAESSPTVRPGRATDDEPEKSEKTRGPRPQRTDRDRRAAS
ncbi:PE-PPE domain-containing protein [Mycobacterium sp. SMC-4]|uniref:PE-PPE domain-containing protein n=1 Tax=Mycobacterium sp. SMC-4 TaxID=2857059 RepID=UPI003CFC7CD5